MHLYAYAAIAATTISFGAAAWGLRRRLTIAHKLTSLCLAIGIGSLVLVASISLQRSEQALLSLKEDKLEATSAAYGRMVENYFYTIDQQILNFARNGMITEATAAFAQSFDQVPGELSDRDTSSGGPAYASLQHYYDQEFRPRVEAAGQTWRGMKTYIPASPAGRLLQSVYISDNPHPVGEKLALASDPANADYAYDRHHAKYHPIVRSYLESFGYYDIFLFDLKGNLTYSVFKETDFATNFLTGPYKSSNFAAVYRAALAAPAGESVIEDFQPYEPSYGAYASFIGAPVFHEGQRVGVAVFQMPVDNINDMMTQAVGMGETGQVYLLGVDSLMRSNSRFSVDGETTLGTQQITGKAATGIKAGESGVTECQSYRGKAVLQAYTPLQLKGLDWGIIAEAELAEISAPAAALQRDVLWVAGLAVLGIVAVALFFSRRLIRPLAPIVRRAAAIAEGDLTGAPLKVTTQDEFGQLTTSFNHMNNSISELISQVSSTAGNVAAGADQILQNSTQTAEHMQRQQDEISQVAAAITEMAASVSEVADQTVGAAEQARSAGGAAEEGGIIIDETVRGMQSIANAVNASADSVRELGQRSEQIGTIVATINDIADQTNLLALNAAIEAARAGEHGRGFAVVADEVRKLADRTTQATQEIADSITAIQHGTHEAVERMEAGSSSVSAGVDQAGEAGQSMKRIVSSADDVTTRIVGIATATEEQSATSEHINQSIDAIARGIGGATDGANEAAAAADALAQQATELGTLIARFKLQAA